MSDWNAAVSSGDAVTLVDLILASTASPAQALALLRSCVSLCELKVKDSAARSQASFHVGASKIDHPVKIDQSTLSDELNKDDPGAWTTGALCTLQGVQLLHPRGRFDLEFRSVGLTVSGKAGTAALAWDNVRHFLRLPRPEGFSWGKMDSGDPAGSDLLAVPLANPVSFRKSVLSLVLIQPDPKAKHTEVSATVEGVSHKVAGSQGTVIMELLKLFLPRVKLFSPDRMSFLSRDGKSFVKCYHGVHEGSLFPLNQGLLFMKPGLFLPLEDIEEVVCGRGGSAQTRYVDLVVTMQASSGDETEKDTREEFSNINRDDLSSLQHYIQSALVAPRQREARRAEKARRAGESPLTAPSATVDGKERALDKGAERQTVQENGVDVEKAVADGSEDRQDNGRQKATSRSSAAVAQRAIYQRQGASVEDDEDEDEEDEEDETFEPPESDGDSSGDDSRIEDDNNDDDTSNGEEELDEEEPDNMDVDGGQSASRAKRSRATDDNDDDDDGDPNRGVSEVAAVEGESGEEGKDDGDNTDSDDGARSRHPAKRAR